MGVDNPNEKVLADLIGQMTITWNECQSIIFMMFYRALDVGIVKATAIFFALRSDGTQRDITAALLPKSVPHDLAHRAIAAINDFGKIAGRRNDFIHGMWHYEEPNGPPIVWLDTRKNLIGKDTLSEGQRLIDDLRSMVLRLHYLREEIQQAMEPPKNALAQPSGLMPQQHAQKASSGQAPQIDSPSTPLLPPEASEE